MKPTPSPITPTPDQAVTILLLEAAGAVFGAEVDAGPLDTTAHQGCSNDTDHGPAVVCTKDEDLCLPCGVGWIAWHPGQRVAIDVLQEPATTETRAVA